MTGFIYPMEGSWTWGGASVFGLYTLGDLGFSDFAGSGIVHMAGAASCFGGRIGVRVLVKVNTVLMAKLTLFRGQIYH